MSEPRPTSMNLPPALRNIRTVAQDFPPASEASSALTHALGAAPAALADERAARAERDRQRAETARNTTITALADLLSAADTPTHEGDPHV